VDLADLVRACGVMPDGAALPDNSEDTAAEGTHPLTPSLGKRGGDLKMPCVPSSPLLFPREGGLGDEFVAGVYRQIRDRRAKPDGTIGHSKTAALASRGSCRGLDGLRISRARLSCASTACAWAARIREPPTTASRNAGSRLKVVLRGDPQR